MWDTFLNHYIHYMICLINIQSPTILYYNLGAGDVTKNKLKLMTKLLHYQEGPPSLVAYDQDEDINQRLGAVKISTNPISPTLGGCGKSHGETLGKLHINRQRAEPNENFSLERAIKPIHLKSLRPILNPVKDFYQPDHS